MPCKRIFVFYFMEFVPFDSQNAFFLVGHEFLRYRIKNFFNGNTVQFVGYNSCQNSRKTARFDSKMAIRSSKNLKDFILLNCA